MAFTMAVVTATSTSFVTATAIITATLHEIDAATYIIAVMDLIAATYIIAVTDLIAATDIIIITGIADIDTSSDFAVAVIMPVSVTVTFTAELEATAGNIVAWIPVVSFFNLQLSCLLYTRGDALSGVDDEHGPSYGFDMNTWFNDYSRL